jgi:enoyl-CoA hydratase/carnithine racemase
MPFQFINARVDDGVAILTINRPDLLNAFHSAACAELGQALDWYETDETARVAIITGAGDRAFSAGFDLQYAEQHPEVYSDLMFGSELVRRERRKPVIAAVNGVALGFGFELALACDIIVASDKARFGLPEVKVGLAAMAGGVARLTRELGPKRTLGMVLTGELVTASEGYRLGFVNQVADGDVMAVALEWAAKIANNAPLSVVASKQMVYSSMDMPDIVQALDPHLYPAVLTAIASDDAQEGRRAFLERRTPHWKGR